jgi:hypothetical protein
MVAQLEVRLKEGWFDMGILKKALNVVSPAASVINKSGPVAKMLGMEQKKAVARPMGSGVVDMVKKGQAQNALQEGKARIAPKKMSKGGAMHKMPDGSMMKGAVHKASSGKYIKPKKKKKNTKVSKSQCSRRADGCAVKGKTRGRMV